jgi:hypothetical protein
MTTATLRLKSDMILLPLNDFVLAVENQIDRNQVLAHSNSWLGLLKRLLLHECKSSKDVKCDQDGSDNHEC